MARILALLVFLFFAFIFVVQDVTERQSKAEFVAQAREQCQKALDVVAAKSEKTSTDEAALDALCRQFPEMR